MAKKVQRRQKKEKDSGISFKYKQKDTDEEIVSRKRKKKDEGIKGEKMKRTEAKDSSSTAGKKAADNKKFLMNLFSGGVSSRDTEFILTLLKKNKYFKINNTIVFDCLLMYFPP